ncbi:MAG: hypothetical protein WC373_06885 [Smithella sp.]
MRCAGGETGKLLIPAGNRNENQNCRIPNAPPSKGKAAAHWEFDNSLIKTGEKTMKTGKIAERETIDIVGDLGFCG